MNDEGMWIEYLGIINMMAETPGMYLMDSKRQEHHEELLEYYSEYQKNFNKERFENVCHNLDKVIDFKPPIERYESLKVFANDASKYMWGRGRLYCTERIDKM